MGSLRGDVRDNSRDSSRGGSRDGLDKPRAAATAPPSRFLASNQEVANLEVSNPEVSNPEVSNPEVSNLEATNLEVMYPIVETFYSVQGEGYWTGQSAFFIRLGGCDVGCTWCDTKHSWEADRHPQRSVRDLVAEAAGVASPRVIVTGGEPTLHDLRPLVLGLRGAGCSPHLETAGAHPLQGEFDWVTLSPKPWRSPDPSIYSHVDELKVVVAEPADLDWAEAQASQVAPATLKLLQPEWSSPEAKTLVYHYVLQHPDWRISLQTHKFLKVR